MVRKRFPALPGLLLGDPTRIRQIISNLLSNALKFTEHGHVALRLTLERSEGEQQHVCISVSDTGIGIPEQAINDIFSPFTQADAQISRRFGGTGLGLTLCKSLTDAMHGELSVESTQGRGSTFSVRLPLLRHEQAPRYARPQPCSVLIWNQRGHLQGGTLQRLLESWQMQCKRIDYAPDQELPDSLPAARCWLIDSPQLAERLRERKPDIPRLLICSYSQQLDKARAEACHVRQQVATPPPRHRLARAIDNLFEAQPSSEASTAQQQMGNGQRLLLVEDNAVNQMVAKGMLSRLGFQVDLAEHGEIALTKLAEQDYDLVLMDCNMPVMDGYETSRRMRADPRWQNLPIVALTANALHEDRQRCKDAGMDDYLAKPVKREDLQAILQRWLKPAE